MRDFMDFEVPDPADTLNRGGNAKHTLFAAYTVAYLFEDKFGVKIEDDRGVYVSTTRRNTISVNFDECGVPEEEGSAFLKEHDYKPVMYARTLF